MSQQPRLWKHLERHPLSAEYGDITHGHWKALLDSITDLGFDSKKPIILAPDEADGGKIKVGDGWQRQRACVQLGVRPVYVMLSKNITLEQLIRRDNDARRHESVEQHNNRLAARKTRVAAAVEAGKSYRAIAEDEGVNVSTVHSDAKATGAAEKNPRKKVERVSHPATNGKPKFDDKRLYRVLKDVRPVLDKKADIVGKGDLPVLSADLKNDRDNLADRLSKVAQAKTRSDRCHELMSALLEEIKLWS
jgi:hypothetical protein